MRNGYEAPKPQEIRRKRMLCGWSPETLAREAKVSLSTVKRAELGRRMQLGSLKEIARALKVPIEQIVPRLRDSKPFHTGRSEVRVLSVWARAEPFMIKAENSILIVDSYFGEYSRLGLVLKARAREFEPLARLDVYMASPEQNFGAQRQREAGIAPGLSPIQPVPLSDQIKDSALDDYEAHFYLLANNISSVAASFTDSANVFEYYCMPSLRIIAIDDVHFFFGWFPLFAQNPGHTCFYLRADETLEGIDLTLLSEIKLQIEGVRLVSSPILKRGDRQRLNRRGQTAK